MDLRSALSWKDELETAYPGLSQSGDGYVAAADGGPGTGYGIVGGYVALVVGLIAVVLGGLALSRARRTVH